MTGPTRVVAPGREHRELESKRLPRIMTMTGHVGRHYLVYFKFWETMMSFRPKHLVFVEEWMGGLTCVFRLGGTSWG